jgi:hypothetical protein
LGAVPLVFVNAFPDVIFQDTIIASCSFVVCLVVDFANFVDIKGREKGLNKGRRSRMIFLIKNFNQKFQFKKAASLLLFSKKTMKFS